MHGNRKYACPVVSCTKKYGRIGTLQIHTAQIYHRQLGNKKENGKLKLILGQMVEPEMKNGKMSRSIFGKGVRTRAITSRVDKKTAVHKRAKKGKTGR